MAIGHGNGPQVGFILRRSELAAHELHEVPLDVCDADTQGAIGYELQQTLGHDFARLGLDRQAVTVVTQVEVDRDDPAFAAPVEADRLVHGRRDGGPARGARAGRSSRTPDAAGGVVVASPKPIRIVELPAVRTLAAAGFVVITVGGGGIPVVADAQGNLHGVAAVIDKDFASSLLASELEADVFVITTAVERVALDFGKPTQRWLDRLTLAEAKQLPRRGQPLRGRAAWRPRSRPASGTSNAAAAKPSSPTRRTSARRSAAPPGPTSSGNDRDDVIGAGRSPVDGHGPAVTQPVGR